jgi:hypothetical protein
MPIFPKTVSNGSNTREKTTPILNENKNEETGK